MCLCYSFQGSPLQFMVGLIKGSEDFTTLDPGLTKVYVPCLAFWCLRINKVVKFPFPKQHCNVFSLVLYLFFVMALFCFSLYCVFSPTDCDDMHLPHFSFLPAFYHCVIISNVCDFADGFMKKDKKKRRDRRGSCGVQRWVVVDLVVIIIASFWHEYVCKDTIVLRERWEHFKIENKIKRMLTVPISGEMVCFSALAQRNLLGGCTVFSEWSHFYSTGTQACQTPEVGQVVKWAKRY